MEIKKFILEAVRQGKYDFLNQSYSGSVDENTSTQGNKTFLTDSKSNDAITYIIDSLFKNTSFQPSKFMDDFRSVQAYK